jgi:molybdate transport system substrate-binding protein
MEVDAMNNAKLGLLLALVISTPAQAAEITFLVGGALKPVMEELAPALSAQANGHEIKMSFGLASKMTDEIKNGRAFDLVFFPVAEVDALLASGKVAASSKATPVRSNIALIVTEGAPKPDVSSVEGFKRTMVEAKSVAITAQGPSGLTMARIFDRLRISEVIKPKLVLVPPGNPVAGVVSRGDAQIGAQQLSEVMGFKGVAVAGTLPAELGGVTTYALGVAAEGQNSGAANAIASWLQSPEAAEAFRTRGFQAP